MELYLTPYALTQAAPQVDPISDKFAYDLININPFGTYPRLSKHIARTAKMQKILRHTKQLPHGITVIVILLSLGHIDHGRP